MKNAESLRNAVLSTEADCTMSHFASMSDMKIYMEGYRAALEAAAHICDQQALEPECPERAEYCADAIRALAASQANSET